MSEVMSRDCPGCRQRVRVYVPKGGDGSAVFYVLHRTLSRVKRMRLSGPPCEYSLRIAEPADLRGTEER